MNKPTTVLVFYPFFFMLLAVLGVAVVVVAYSISCVHLKTKLS